MVGLKDFRRSLNKDRTSGGKPGNNGLGGSAQGGFTQVTSGPPTTFTNVKSAVSLQPPKMVIKAIQDYKSRAPQELSFTRGDFFHVISEPTGQNADWLEACNPITNARGLVPAACFEVLSRQARPGQGGAPMAAGASTGGASVMSTLGKGPANMTPQASQQQQAKTPAQRAAGAAMTAKGGGGLYAMVRYDFTAERDDELGAAAGEPIIVIAQSNFEWFVAKPIGRLGGPGLIPVAFVEIKDLASGKAIENVEELISSGVIPTVEEWKKMTADYKKNTIPLGRFDFGGSNGESAAEAGSGGQASHFASSSMNGSGSGSQQRGMPENDEGPSPRLPEKDFPWSQDGSSHPGEGLSQGQQYQTQEPENAVAQDDLPPGMPPGEPLPVGLITHATVDSFHYEQGDYWFRIQVAHVAGVHSSAPPPPNAPRAAEGEERELILYRLYEDFYDFQIALLDHFSVEAGRQIDENGKQSKRILPLMPGPLEQVDDYITAQRRGDLDQYIAELCALPEYILRSEIVRLFFEPRPGDHCTTHPPRIGAGMTSLPSTSSKKGMVVTSPKEDNYLTAGSQYAGYGDQEGVEEMRSPNPEVAGFSNGTSKYSQDSAVGAHARNASQSTNGGNGPSRSYSSSQSSQSQQSTGYGDLPTRFESLNTGPGQSQRNSLGSGRAPSGYSGNAPLATSSSGSHLVSKLQPPSTGMSRDNSQHTIASRDSRGSRNSLTGASGGASGPSEAAGAAAASSAPLGSGSGASAPSFIKIKIFSRTSDDLVAIRVPPTVTYDSLMEKVRARLGPDVGVLRYPEGSAAPGAPMVRMHDDEDLKEWLASGLKLNLYADKN